MQKKNPFFLLKKNKKCKNYFSILFSKKIKNAKIIFPFYFFEKSKKCKNIFSIFIVFQAMKNEQIIFPTLFFSINCKIMFLQFSSFSTNAKIFFHIHFVFSKT